MAEISQLHIKQPDGTWVPLVGTEDGSLAVNLTDADGGVELTGDLVVDTLGALNNAKVVDPDAASATIPALLRGQLVQALAVKNITGTAADDEADVTIIGLLTRIAIGIEALAP